MTKQKESRADSLERILGYLSRSDRELIEGEIRRGRNLEECIERVACWVNPQDVYLEIRSMRDDIYNARKDRRRAAHPSPETKTNELLNIAREVATMDCFYSGSTHDPDCQCIVGRAERAIAPLTQETATDPPK